MMLLTLADSAAALVGTTWSGASLPHDGRLQTLEGSAAFFVVAFACIALPLAWFTPATNPESIAVAALIALAVTVLEAAIGGGFDNLLVPLGAFAAIKDEGCTGAARPDSLESGYPLAVAGLCVAAALLFLLVAVLASWRRTSALGESSTSASD